jgi:hypothetical protein
MVFAPDCAFLLCPSVGIAISTHARREPIGTHLLKIVVVHEVGILHNAQDRGIVLYTTKPHEQRAYTQ